jgi:Fungal specific transcription factor domain
MQKKLLLELANDSINLQSALLDWYSQSLIWTATRSAANPTAPYKLDPQLTIAHIYYHAISIFLSGIFDYRPYWSHVPAPRLGLQAVEKTLGTLLPMIEAALKTSNLAGVLFLFPLRVAGARTRATPQKEQILKLLQSISRRNFVVADAFMGDLTTLWGAGSQD